MPSLASTRALLACCALSTSACADILGLGDFTFGDGGNTSTSTTGGNGDDGDGVSDGGMGGTPVMAGGAGGDGGTGGSGGMPNSCDNPVTYANRIVCDGPALYLRFEDRDSAAPMTNDSPFGVVPNGSYGGNATFTEGVPGIGGAALQQGPGRSEVGDSTTGLDFAPLDPYSVEVWVRAPSSTTDTFAFIGTWDGDSQGHSLFVFPQSEPSGTPQDLEYKRNAAPNTFFCAQTGDCTLTPDTFQHVVATFNPEPGGFVTLYVDGVSIGTKSLTNDLLVPPNPFAISGPGSEFVIFDELAVYDYVLTDDQVSDHYKCATDGDC